MKNIFGYFKKKINVLDSQQKFQFKLAMLTTILTIVGMIGSGLISGCFVYSLSQQPPIVSIVPVNVNWTENTLKLSVSSFNDKSARNVKVSYSIPDLDNITYSENTIPVLFNQQEFFSVNITTLNKKILEKITEEMGVSFSNQPFDKKYYILFNVKCDNCKINYPKNIYYLPTIQCFWRERDNKSECYIMTAEVEGI